jgi:hypothetical protein
LQYTKTIDVWSIGCIFAEILSGKPLFPGRNVVHQLELITDLLGTPSAEEIAKVRNEKARRFLSQMKPKAPVPFATRFPRAHPSAVRLLERLLSFDPNRRCVARVARCLLHGTLTPPSVLCRTRPGAEEALLDPYFVGLHNPTREPLAEPISKLEYEFEKRKLTVEEVRDLIYREVLEYHPQAKREYMTGEAASQFVFPSAVDNFKRQFAHLEGAAAGGVGATRELRRQAQSLPREQMVRPRAALTVRAVRAQCVRSPSCVRPVLHRTNIATKLPGTWRAQTRSPRAKRKRLPRQTALRTACRR